MGKEELRLDGGRTAEKKSEDPVQEDMTSEKTQLYCIFCAIVYFVFRDWILEGGGGEQIAGATKEDN